MISGAGHISAPGGCSFMTSSTIAGVPMFSENIAATTSCQLFLLVTSALDVHVVCKLIRYCSRENAHPILPCAGSKVVRLCPLHFRSNFSV